MEVACDGSDPADPPVDVRWEVGRARFGLRGGGRIDIATDPATVSLHLPGPVPPECVVQPHLSSAAAAFNLWDRAAAIHGGAFIHDGHAWILVGDKGAGKTSTLALLAEAGFPILADDLSIWRDGSVLAGPRCVDLRADAAAALGIGRPLGHIGSRQRWRLDIPDAGTAAPLGGLLRLEWAERTALCELGLREALSAVLGNHPLPVEVVPSAATLDVAAAPVFSWARPPGWPEARRAVQELVDWLPSR